MKLLFTVPHFYKPLDGIEYGSSSSSGQSRIDALSKLILAIHQQFGARVREMNMELADLTAAPILGGNFHEVSILICTTGGNHLLDHLTIPQYLYEHCPTQAQDNMLGFECHRILEERLGIYDYYCFLEDDLVILDSQFFEKLRQFNHVFGPENLLQPNRYELSANTHYMKLYLDGRILPNLSKPFQEIMQQPTLQMPVAGSLIKFQRRGNPHSGCFFLNQEQMQFWARMPYFRDGDTSFVGPLESAASLGIMKTFRVYKPVAESINFLEILHGDPRFIQRLE